MESIHYTELDNICRFCLKRNLVLNPIFKNNERSLAETTDENLIEMIAICTGLEVTIDDRLPKCMCSACLKQLLASNSFRKQCLSSTEYLISLTIKEEPYQISNSLKHKHLSKFDEIAIESCVQQFEEDLKSNEDLSSEMLTDADRNTNNNSSIMTNEQREAKRTVVKKTKEPKQKSEKEKLIQICQICGALRHNLKQHMSTHSDDKPCRCDICGLSVKTREILKKHMRVHDEIRPYKCSLCNAAFKTSSHRKKHFITHTKERNFLCNLCDKSFFDASTRDSHRLTHGQERKFKCEYCSKLFLKAAGLKNHIGIHTGEHPYKCGLCPKTFINTSSASQHRRTHLVNNFYKCNVCEMEFQLINLLKIHMRHEKHYVNF